MSSDSRPDPIVQNMNDTCLQLAGRMREAAQQNPEVQSLLLMAAWEPGEFSRPDIVWVNQQGVLQVTSVEQTLTMLQAALDTVKFLTQALHQSVFQTRNDELRRLKAPYGQPTTQS